MWNDLNITDSGIQLQALMLGTKSSNCCLCSLTAVHLHKLYSLTSRTLLTSYNLVSKSKCTIKDYIEVTSHSETELISKREENQAFVRSLFHVH
uniref:Uncharacterized protein n=1 Tax=Rhipicephalus appendiculatus TaxID=34631 RepID=A0A131YDQ8_RHIAP